MQRFKNFKKSEDGTMTIEAAIVLPFLLYVITMTYMFWDVFHAQAVSQRATYTIADTLSRHELEVDQAYIDGLDDVHRYLLQGRFDSRLRISFVAWDNEDEDFAVVWSKTPDSNWTEHTDATLNDMSDSIPSMSQGDVAIIVETQVRFIPFLSGIIDPLNITSLVVTRPRFSPQLVWENEDGTTIGYGSVDT